MGCLCQPSSCGETSGNLPGTPKAATKILEDEAFWFNGGKKEGAKKYPRISVPVISEDPAKVDAQPPPAPNSKKVLDRSEKELKKLKVTELVSLLTEIVRYQPNLPKKPWKPDVLSKILDVAIPRGD